MRTLVTVLFLLAVVVGGVAVVYGFSVRGEPVVQPIVFNHTIHIDEGGMECVECHSHAEAGTYAGLPSKIICLDCHDIDDEAGSHPEKDKLFAYDDSELDIPWVRVAVTQPDVYFSHRRHVSAAKMDCLECHADQADLTAPPSTARLVMTMDDCIDCHEQKGASSDCLVCHR